MTYDGGTCVSTCSGVATSSWAPPPFPERRPPKAKVSLSLAAQGAASSPCSRAVTPGRPPTGSNPKAWFSTGGDAPKLDFLDGVAGLSAPKPSRRILATGEAPPVPVPPSRRLLPQRRTVSSSPTSFMAALSDGEDTLPFTPTRSAPSCPPPIVRNVATYTRPRDYEAAIRNHPALQLNRPPLPGRQPQERLAQSRKARKSPIDQAVQRQVLGTGLALNEAVTQKKAAGWAVQQRQLQKADVGHCCHGCRQPLRDMNEEVTVWTGAAIYRRFHPACAATFVLKCDGETAEGSDRGAGEDVVESYADGWRSLNRAGPGAADGNPRGAEAARQWLLSQDPHAWQGLRGDLFSVVTVIENGQKKAVPGLSHDQFRLLETRHKWTGAKAEENPDEAPVECAICFGDVDEATPCVGLPCAPQHVFHLSCVSPWLRKASLCPTCRCDLRPLLSSSGQKTRRWKPQPTENQSQNAVSPSSKNNNNNNDDNNNDDNNNNNISINNAGGGDDCEGNKDKGNENNSDDNGNNNEHHNSTNNASNTDHNNISNTASNYENDDSSDSSTDDEYYP